MILDSSGRKRRPIPASQRALGGALLFAVLCLHAPRAHADEAELRAAARDLAAQGAQAFEAGKFEQASDFFRRAYELVQAPSIALMRARSLAKIGHFLQATDIYEQTARLKLAADAPDAYVTAVQSARSEVEEVRKHLAHLKLSLAGAQPGESVAVTIDDKPTPTALLGVEQPIDPGVHALVARSGEVVRASQEVTMVEGQRYEIDLQLSANVAPAAPVAPHQTEIAAENMPRPRPHPPVLGYVALGVGGVGLAVGTVTGLVALHHKSNLDAACHPGCPPSSQADLDGFRSNRTVSWISYGVGIAAGATGLLLLTLGNPDHEHVALHALPNGFSLTGRL